MINVARLLFEIFTADLLPVFVIAAVGFLLARLGGVPVRAASKLTFNALAPALVFHSLATSALSGDQFWRMAFFYLLVAGAAAAMARLAAIPLRLDRRALGAFMLVVVCSNSGNYGLPVVQLAFGREALAFASVYFVSSSMFTFTGGVLLAASGRRSIPSALAGILTVPAFYAAVAAVLVLNTGFHVPDVVMRPVGMLGDAALPMMIVVLGMQLERATLPERPGVVAAAVSLSLVLTPVAAIALAHLIGLRGAAFQAGVLQSSMPSAVMTTILALEFDALPQFVTSVVCFGTLISPLTVTLLIAYLQRVG